MVILQYFLLPQNNKPWLLTKHFQKKTKPIENTGNSSWVVVLSDINSGDFIFKFSLSPEFLVVQNEFQTILYMLTEVKS